MNIFIKSPLNSLKKEIFCTKNIISQKFLINCYRKIARYNLNISLVFLLTYALGNIRKCSVRLTPTYVVTMTIYREFYL